MKEEHQDANKFAYVNAKSKRRIFVDNLVGGIAWGVGSIIGATIIIGALGLLVTRSKNIPLVGDVVQIIIEEINQGRNVDIFIDGQTTNN